MTPVPILACNGGSVALIDSERWADSTPSDRRHKLTTIDVISQCRSTVAVSSGRVD